MVSCPWPDESIFETERLRIERRLLGSWRLNWVNVGATNPYRGTAISLRSPGCGCRRFFPGVLLSGVELVFPPLTTALDGKLDSWGSAIAVLNFPLSVLKYAYAPETVLSLFHHVVRASGRERLGGGHTVWHVVKRAISKLILSVARQRELGCSSASERSKSVNECIQKSSTRPDARQRDFWQIYLAPGKILAGAKGKPRGNRKE